MNTPLLPLLVTAVLRLFVATLASLSLSQCAHSDKKTVAPVPQDRSEWYLACKEPLTYCPKGRLLPAANLFEPATFVYLPDRRTRFYIPPKDKRHRQQALAWRANALREDGVSSNEVAQDVAVALIVPLWPCLAMCDYLLTGGEWLLP